MSHKQAKLERQVTKTPRQHKLFYGSSYDRGLQHLLKMWPKIIAAYPDATLDICYGWELFDKGYAYNPERMAWKERINEQMRQPGITHHGRVSKEELKRIEKECGIWAYPTHFGETNCITALDCQQNGCVPCVINYAGLKESVGSGVRIEGDIYDDGVAYSYLEALLELMANEPKWLVEQLRGIEFAKDFSWQKIAERWVDVFKA